MRACVRSGLERVAKGGKSACIHPRRLGLQTLCLRDGVFVKQCMWGGGRSVCVCEGRVCECMPRGNWITVPLKDVSVSVCPRLHMPPGTPPPALEPWGQRSGPGKGGRGKKAKRRRLQGMALPQAQQPGRGRN